MRRRILAGLLVVAILAGCGDDGDAVSSTTSPAPTSPTPDLDVFCSAMRDPQTSGAQAPAELEAIYSDVAANAPLEIEDEVSTFLRYSRAVSDAFVAAGAPDSEVDSEAVLASLSADERQFVEDLAGASETGELPEGPAGAVLGYVLENCP